jgi:hypothetical protein
MDRDANNSQILEAMALKLIRSGQSMPLIFKEHFLSDYVRKLFPKLLDGKYKLLIILLSTHPQMALGEEKKVSWIS